MKYKTKDITLTPLGLINKLGKFDLDPCGFLGHNTAERIIVPPKDGLKEKWIGKIWLNPPYSNVEPFLEKMVEHNNGIALILASVETRWFHKYVWGKASGILFIKGRPKFLREDGIEIQLMRATVLVSYGEECNKLLKNSNLEGMFINLEQGNMSQKIKPFNFPPIPLSLLGRKRKDGKADKRFVNGILVQKEWIDKVSGVTEILKSSPDK